MKKDYMYPALLTFTEQCIEITFPDLEEALSQADTIEQAMKRAQEVLLLTIESRLEDKEEIPNPTPLNQVSLSQTQRTILVFCSINQKIKYDKKTLTIPHDLNVAAEEAGLNFSQVLQKALREELADVEKF